MRSRRLWHQARSKIPAIARGLRGHLGGRLGLGAGLGWGRGVDEGTGGSEALGDDVVARRRVQPACRAGGHRGVVDLARLMPRLRC